MRKIVYQVCLMLTAIWMLTACEAELLPGDYAPGANGQLVFSLHALRGEIGEESLGKRSAGGESGIKQLHFVLFDEHNRIVQPRSQQIAPDFSSLTLEGVPGGAYSMALFATTSDDEAVVRPVVADDKLSLINPSTDKPLDADYLFARTNFIVSEMEGSRRIDVSLRRLVGRVDVDVNAVHPYTAYQIKRVSLSLNAGSEVFLSHNGGNEQAFEGTGTITDLDLTDNRCFYSFPSQEPISGTVTVESVREDGTKVQDRFNFSDVAIEEGKITTIRVDWKAANSNRGLFRVVPSDYTAENTSEMFLDDEPREVFYNPSLRLFRTDQPLQVRINSDRQLQLNFYSPATIRNVTVLCRFKKYSTEFFKFAQYDVVTGFSESRMYIPLTDRSLTYTSKDGRNIVIPAQSDLKNEDCEFRIESDDPYMVKIATITHPITISYSPYGADDGHPYWRHMTPQLCRHASVLMVNMSYMFSSQEFVRRVHNWLGNPFVDDSLQPISPETVIARARSVSRLYMGAVEGVGGLGGSTTFGLAHYCYTGQYWDTEDKYSYAKTAIFHEYGHCMGYGHDSSMTYGDAWTTLCQDLAYDLGSTGQLPVSNSNWK